MATGHMGLDSLRLSLVVPWVAATATAIACLGGWTAPAGAQADAPGHSVLVSVTRDHVSVYGGDATVGPLSTGGWSGSLEMRTTRHIGGGVFYSESPPSDGSNPSIPGLRKAGGWVTFSLTQTPQSGGDAFLGLGLSYFGVRGWPDLSGCRPELGCFAEGGPGFENGDTVTLVAGGGATFAYEGLLLRGDLRVFVPNTKAHEPQMHAGLGVGILVSGWP